MTPAATVSVALCTHNGEQFVRQQLASILGQTVLPNEVVVSDDASTDETVSIVRADLAEWQHAHPESGLRSTILQNGSALGVAANFARAISECSGELIVLSDQDDVWHPDRIETMLTAFESDPELLLLHGDADLVDGDGSPLGSSLFEALEVTPETQRQVHDGLAFEVLMHRNLVTGATTAFRRELGALALPVPDGWLHDEWLAVVGAATGRVDLTTARLLDYRQHGQNQIGVSKLSIGGKFGRMMETGTDRSARLLVRAGSLVERLREIPGVPANRLAAAEEKVEHERIRSALSSHRIARVLPVLRELPTGRYRKYGRGVLDAARDLLQPLPSAGASATVDESIDA